jgi:Ser/Thr protein kinase RdoA (MazF antagonist)
VLYHGDLQPANVLADRGGSAWLIDFKHACLAPPVRDPAKLVILARRFGDPAQVDEVLAA